MKIVVISEASERDHSAIFPSGNIEMVRVRYPGQLEEDPQLRRDAALFLDLDFTTPARVRPDAERIRQLSRLLPAPVLVNAVAPTLHEIGQPFVRINAWPGFLEKNIHELVAPDDATLRKVEDVYTKLGRSCRFVPDIPGMISARVLAALINEAYFTLQEEVSTKKEIDIAMRLGTNYPLGPFEWGERIGLENIGQLLSLLSLTEDRYAPAPALKNALQGIKI
ncbi:MAG TPA: 3-hydroxyacyl-CoA dehydrogenase family protein [Puia sp.]|nr:3-hydroxyacyl-CoA dehydrogenase family protein [Puia sp.]